MARECRKMCGDIGLPSKLGVVDPDWEAARRTMCVAPKRVRRSLWTPTKDRPVHDWRGRVRSIGPSAIAPDP